MQSFLEEEVNVVLVVLVAFIRLEASWVSKEFNPFVGLASLVYSMAFIVFMVDLMAIVPLACLVITLVSFQDSFQGSFLDLAFFMAFLYLMVCSFLSLDFKLGLPFLIGYQRINLFSSCFFIIRNHHQINLCFRSQDSLGSYSSFRPFKPFEPFTFVVTFIRITLGFTSSLGSYQMAYP